MECRICNQRISFVKGNHPGRKRKSTRAVHESELSDALTQANGEVVTPHPGVQRKLRQELEGKHRREQQATAEAQHAAASSESDEQAEGAEWVSKATA
ncbi:MAG TPA: hypothetical protein VIC84_15350 [Blastocatellia bacterium]|jgi:hypothetical protein